MDFQEPCDQTLGVSSPVPVCIETSKTSCIFNLELNTTSTDDVLGSEEQKRQESIIDEYLKSNSPEDLLREAEKELNDANGTVAEDADTVINKYPEGTVATKEQEEKDQSSVFASSNEEEKNWSLL